MRPQIMLRAVPAIVAAGALGFVISPAVGAPVAATAVPNTTGSPIDTALKDATLRPGQPVVVSGRLASGQSAAPVRLEFLRAGATTWAPLREGTTGPAGGFALRGDVRHSGVVRVVQTGVAQAAAVDGSATPVVASAERKVRVRARLVTGGVRRHVSAGGRTLVEGAVRPGGGGRTVALQLRGQGGWRTVDRDRTDGEGRFRLNQRLSSATSSQARLRFAGDAVNDASSKPIGRVSAYRSALASWYGPGLYGNPLGCGGTLTPGTVGVAHKTLPCGTKLTLRHGGRSVRASVIDRGPYVGAREFDLTAATKAKLGFGSVGTIQVSR